MVDVTVTVPPEASVDSCVGGQADHVQVSVGQAGVERLACCVAVSVDGDTDSVCV